MKNKSIIYALGAMLTFTACSDDYLETTPQSSVSTSTIFESTDNAKLAVNGLCRIMVTQYLSTQGFNGEGTIKMYYGNYPGNDFQKCNLTGWANIMNSNNYHESSTSTYDYYPWYYYYKIIVNANAIITYIDDAEGTDADKAFIKAQGLTFRAYAYFMLSQIYCKRWVDSSNGSTRGLPLRLELTNDDLEASTLAETYAQVYADLDEAISLYNQSGQDRDADDNYSPNINVAYAVYARAALTREDWSTAANYAALARQGYPLMSMDDYEDGFNTPTSEWIWSSYSASDQTLYYYSFFAYIGSNSSASQCRTYPAAISRELFDQIPETDLRRELYLYPADDEVAGTDFQTSNMRAGSSGKMYKRAFSDYADKIYSTSNIYAYKSFKFLVLSQPGIGQVVHFRSSEMVLTEAEADCHLGKYSEAQALLVELNQSTGRDPSYSCTKTGDALLEEVGLYRRFDLWGEGFDWFDYKRWKATLVRHTWDDGGSFHSTFAVTREPSAASEWGWVYPAREADYISLVETVE